MKECNYCYANPTNLNSNDRYIYKEAVENYYTPTMDRSYMRSDNTYIQPMNGNYQPQDERFFWAPFVVGGLAGTALGYGIANNNQINHGGFYGTPVYYFQPQPMPMPYSYNNTNFYY